MHLRCPKFKNPIHASKTGISVKTTSGYRMLTEVSDSHKSDKYCDRRNRELDQKVAGPDNR